MQLSLPIEISKLIEDRIRAGRYASAEEVIAAALTTLDAAENASQFEPGELDRLIRKGDASGEALDAEQVFAEIDAIAYPRKEKAG